MAKAALVAITRDQAHLTPLLATLRHGDKDERYIVGHTLSHGFRRLLPDLGDRARAASDSEDEGMRLWAWRHVQAELTACLDGASPEEAHQAGEDSAIPERTAPPRRDVKVSTYGWDEFAGTDKLPGFRDDYEVPDLHLEGNWILREYEDGGLIAVIHVSLHKSMGLVLSSFFIPSRADRLNEPWRVAWGYGWRLDKHGDRHELNPVGDNPFPVEPDGTVTIWHGDRVVVTLHPDGPGSMSGGWREDNNWTNTHRKGTATFHKVTPKLQSVKFIGDKTDSVAFGEREGKLEFEYQGPVYGRMAANRRAVAIQVFGENLWGCHRLWLDPIHHLEVSGRGIRGEPTLRNGVRHDVTGAHIRLLTWPEMFPGRKVLWLDDIPIPFELVLTGFPEERLPEADPPWGIAELTVERQEGLVMGLKMVLKALGLEDQQYLADKAFWQDLEDGARLFTLDSARLGMALDPETQTKNAAIQWYSRHGTQGTWQPLGTGPEVKFRIPERPGPLQIYGEATVKGKKRKTEPVTFTVEKSACQAFHQQVLIQMADAIHLYRQTVRESKGTYGEDWAKANGGTAPRTIPMAVDPATGKPYTLRSGDVVMRTAGPFSKVLGTLGAPDSPETHTGILRVLEVKIGPVIQNLHLVHHVVAGGYAVMPLTPADAKLLVLDEWQRGHPKGQESTSYLEEANLNSVAVYRPNASVFGGVKFSPSPELGIDVPYRLEFVGRKVRGYDFAFLESSKLSGEAPFNGLYYCHEFVQEVLNIGQDTPLTRAVVAAKLQGFDTNAGTPRHVERLARFWESAFACDREAAKERADRTAAYGPGTLSQLLSDVDLDAITFDDEDPKKDAEVRDKVRSIIKVLRSFLDHKSLRDIITEAVTEGVTEKTAPVKSTADKASDFAASVSDRVGVPKEYAPLVSVGLRTALRSWIAMGDRQIAEYLVEDLIKDLGNVVGTRQLLQGGFSRGEYGEPLFITFEKISQ